MTRIPEGLRRRLEREAKGRRRSMNAEIVARLKQSFDTPDQAKEIAAILHELLPTVFFDIMKHLREIQSQNRAILSHLGLTDPKARKAEAQKAARGRAEAARQPDALSFLVPGADKPEEESK
jgi:hypothetical protein